MGCGRLLLHSIIVLHHEAGAPRLAVATGAAHMAAALWTAGAAARLLAAAGPLQLCGERYAEAIIKPQVLNQL